MRSIVLSLAVACAAHAQSLFGVINAGGTTPSAIAGEGRGSVYVAGNTMSAALPVTAGALQPRYADAEIWCAATFMRPVPPCGDAFIAKLRPDGSAIEYLTYLGGIGIDKVTAIAVDAAGNAYVAGSTTSQAFPVTSAAHRRTYGGGSHDAFVAKLSPRGDFLIYSTYIGGNGSDLLSGLAIDATGRVYVTGSTSSTDFPQSSSGECAQAGCAFASVLSADGATVVATRLWPAAGSGPLVLDASGMPWVALYTGSTRIEKLSADLRNVSITVPIRGLIEALQPDGFGGIYAAGTASTGFSPIPGGEKDGLVVRLSPLGGVVFETFFGGSGGDSIRAVVVDPAGGAFILGTAGWSNIPYAGRPLRRCEELGTSVDFTFLAKIGGDGTVLFSSALLDGAPPAALATAGPGAVFVASVEDARAVVRRLEPTPASGPQPSCVVNAASLSPRLMYSEPNAGPGPVAPGELVTIFGSGLGPGGGANAQFDGAGLLPKSLAGSRVLFDGIPAPLLYVSDRQVNAVIPFGTAGKQTVEMRVERDGVISEAAILKAVPSVPGIFSRTMNGRGQAAALNQDGAVNSVDNPAGVGSIVSVWVTGLGALDPAPADGGTNRMPLAGLLHPVTFLQNGLPVEVLYAGPAPGEVAGVYQVNFRVREVETRTSQFLTLTIPRGNGESMSPPFISIWVEP
jgi:uncharacterized protein (TIGR03437 family)